MALRVFFCSDCNFATKTKTALQRHQANLHGVNVRWFQCDSCSHQSKSLGNLKQHVRRVHGVGLLQCTHQGCSFRAPSYKKMQEHVDESHAVGDRPPRTMHCHRCDFTTTQRGHLNRHLASVHRDTSQRSVVRGDDEVVDEFFSEWIGELDSPRCQPC